IAPDQVFDSPMDVVTTASMTPEQKMKVLKHWEANAYDLQVATEENMTGAAEQSRLAEVKKAIIKLREIENIDEKSVG
ncbi:MAG: hypothetical protein ACREDU_09275, partial [Methylocella sp.]